MLMGAIAASWEVARHTSAAYPRRTLCHKLARSASKPQPRPRRFPNYTLGQVGELTTLARWLVLVALAVLPCACCSGGPGRPERGHRDGPRLREGGDPAPLPPPGLVPPAGDSLGATSWRCPESPGPPFPFGGWACRDRPSRDLPPLRRALRAPPFPPQSGLPPSAPPSLLARARGPAWPRARAARAGRLECPRPDSVLAGAPLPPL
jgi:hypothetical protein